MEKDTQSQYDTDLNNWDGQTDVANKNIRRLMFIRQARKLLIENPNRTDELFESFLNSISASVLEVDDAVELVDFSVRHSDQEGMTQKEEALIVRWLDKLNPTAEKLSSMFTLCAPVKINKVDILGAFTSWAEKRWEGTEKMEQYALGLAQTYIRLTVNHRKGLAQLQRILAHTSPNQKVSAGYDDGRKSWVGAWVGVILLGTKKIPEFEGETLQALLHFGADVEEINHPGGMTPLGLACRAYREGLENSGERAINLLLDHGALWEDMEGEVCPDAWRVIQNHPVVRRQKLDEISRSGSGAIPTPKNKNNVRIKM